MSNNTLIILGNGFDVALDYPTKYSDFYQKSKELRALANNGNSLCKHIINHISDGLWSDLESGLHKYSLSLTQKYGTGDKVQAKKFHDEFEQLRAALFNYLDSVSNMQKDVSKQYPAIGLNVEWSKIENSVFLTFNYSTTTSATIAMNTRRIFNNDDSINPNVFIHQHGSIFNTQKGKNNSTNSIVLGIDEKTQKVEPLHSFLYKTNQAIFDIFHTLSTIRNASNIILFGCSCGDSDALYLQTIFDPGNKGKRYIVYYFGDENLYKLKTNIGKYCGDLNSFSTMNKIDWLNIKDNNVREKTKQIVNDINSGYYVTQVSQMYT